METTLDSALQTMLKIERETGGFVFARASVDGSLVLQLLLGDGSKIAHHIDRSEIKDGSPHHLEVAEEGLILIAGRPV
jgi:hypothetical protein